MFIIRNEVSKLRKELKSLKEEQVSWVWSIIRGVVILFGAWMLVSVSFIFISQNGAVW